MDRRVPVNEWMLPLARRLDIECASASPERIVAEFTRSGKGPSCSTAAPVGTRGIGEATPVHRGERPGPWFGRPLSRRPSAGWLRA